MSWISDWQNLVVAVAICGAAVYLLVSVYRHWSGKKASYCGSQCPDCALQGGHEPTCTQNEGWVSLESVRSETSADDRASSAG